MIYELKTSLRQKIKVDYIDKTNVIHIKTLEIKLILWLVFLLPLKEMWIQTSVMWVSVNSCIYNV
jgi:hypothetical protein